MGIPEQVAYCHCGPDEYRPCNGEFYHCESCGETSENPFPYAEPYNSDHTGSDSSWWYYCRSCAYGWILDGADVRRIKP